MTSLSSMNSWEVSLLKDYAASSNISSLRFGTNVGLEYSVNSTKGDSNGTVRVLSRSATTDCLKTYLEDGVSADDVTYGDNCYYDPKYSDWYSPAVSAATDFTWSNTYNMSFLAAVSKACVLNNCSNDLLGVWASEWTVESISTNLEQLKEGFVGSLAIVDSTGIVLASSSGENMVPASTTSDTYIQDASSALSDSSSQSAASRKRPQSLVGYNLIGYVQMDWEEYPDANNKFLAVMSLDRVQIFKEYQETRSLGVAIFTIGMLLLASFLQVSTSKSKLRFKTTIDMDQEVPCLYVQPHTIVTLYVTTLHVTLNDHNSCDVLYLHWSQIP